MINVEALRGIRTTRKLLLTIKATAKMYMRKMAKRIPQELFNVRETASSLLNDLERMEV